MGELGCRVPKPVLPSDVQVRVGLGVEKVKRECVRHTWMFLMKRAQESVCEFHGGTLKPLLNEWMN